MFFKSLFVATMMFIAACSTGCATQEGCRAVGKAAAGLAGIATATSNNPNMQWRSYEMASYGEDAGEGICRVGRSARVEMNGGFVNGGGQSEAHEYCYASPNVNSQWQYYDCLRWYSSSGPGWRDVISRQ